jgi:hypothetical protein
LSGERLTTQVERMTSTLVSEIGKCSISPRRNSTFFAPTRAAFERAFETIAGVMSTPNNRVRDELGILVDRGVKVELDGIARDIPRLVDDYLPKKLFDSDLVKL